MASYLVTGGNGFVAMHVVLMLAKAGNQVVATVRTETRAKESVSCVPNDLASNVTWTIVADAGAPNAFDDVIKNNKFQYVIHTATPFHYNIKDPHELYDPAVNGTNNILEAVDKYGPSVKRVVVLSSCAAVFNLGKGTWPGGVYDEDDWNPITKEEALSGPPSLAYLGAKTWAEKAVFEYIEKKRPKFDIATIAPPLVFGPVVNYVPDIKSLGTSNALLHSFIDGSLKDQEIPVNMVWAWVDVRDLCQSLIVAASEPKASNQRFVVAASTFSNKQIADIYASKFPEVASNLPKKIPEGWTSEGWPKEGLFSVNNSKSKEVLGLEYRSLETMLVDFMESIKDLN